MEQRYTRRAERALNTARKRVAAKGAAEPGPDHLLLGICRARGGAAEVLQTLGVDPERLAADLEAGKFERAGDVPPARAPGGLVLNTAAAEARRMNSKCIGTEHILFALLRHRAGALAAVLDELKKD